ncbi:unnamed protein product, partial [Polarella glacialis]
DGHTLLRFKGSCCLLVFAVINFALSCAGIVKMDWRVHAHGVAYSSILMLISSAVLRGRRSLEWEKRMYRHVADAGLLLVCAHIWSSEQPEYFDLVASVTIFPLCGQVINQMCTPWQKPQELSSVVAYAACRAALFWKNWANTSHLLWVELAMHIIMTVSGCHFNSILRTRYAAERENIDLLHTAFDCSFIMDTCGQVLDGVSQLDCIAKCHMVGWNFKKLITPDGQGRFEDFLFQLRSRTVSLSAAQGALQCFTVIRDAEGSEFDVELRCVKSCGRNVIALRIHGEKRQSLADLQECKDITDPDAAADFTLDIPLGAEYSSFHNHNSHHNNNNNNKNKNNNHNHNNNSNNHNNCAKSGADIPAGDMQGIGKLTVGCDGTVQTSSPLWAILFRQDSLEGMKMLDCVFPPDHDQLQRGLHNFGTALAATWPAEQVQLRFAREADKTIFQVSVEMSAAREATQVDLTVCSSCEELGHVRDLLQPMLMPEEQLSHQQHARAHRTNDNNSSSSNYSSNRRKASKEGVSLTSIDEDVPSVDMDVPSVAAAPAWIRHFATHLAVHVFPRLPAARHRRPDWEGACSQIRLVVELLSSGQDSNLAHTYHPCMGFSCTVCEAAIEPHESSCQICGEPAD